MIFSPKVLSWSVLFWLPNISLIHLEIVLKADNYAFIKQLHADCHLLHENMS